MFRYQLEHPLPAGAREASVEEATINSRETRTALLLAAFVAGFTQLYRDKHGELTAPDVVARATRRVRDELDPYTPILEPDDDACMVDFTGKTADGVLHAELWAFVRFARELASAKRLNVGREKAAFEAAMTRREASLLRSRTRFGNRSYWRGVRWDAHFAARQRVTLPHWDQAQEGDGDGTS